MRIQDHFSISVNLDVGCGHRRVSVCSAQVCVPLGHSSLYFAYAFIQSNFTLLTVTWNYSVLDTIMYYGMLTTWNGIRAELSTIMLVSLSCLMLACTRLSHCDFWQI